MVRYAGVGSITTKGLDIIAYCNASTSSLNFTNFYVTNRITETLTNIQDPDYVFGVIVAPEIGLLRTDMDTVLSLNYTIKTGVIQPNTNILYTTSRVILPLICELPANAIDALADNFDATFYYMFAIDPRDNLEYLFYKGCLAHDGTDVIPVPIFAGLNFPIRSNLRYASGELPTNIGFLNTLASELDVHNTNQDPDTHFDIRAAILVNDAAIQNDLSNIFLRLQAAEATIINHEGRLVAHGI